LTRHALAALGLALPLVLAASHAQAQLHADASAELGFMKRDLQHRPSGNPRAGFGPAGQLTAHIALMPLVRVGAYLGHDISPFEDDSTVGAARSPSARDITWGGLRAKLMSPWPRGDARVWLFVGFGYAGVYQRSTTTTAGFPGPGGAVSVQRVVHGAGGGFFEVPFGFGASYKLRKPWQLCAELGARAGFGHSGSVYEAPGPRTTTESGEGHVPPAGIDRFAIGMTFGILLDL
jgi:hypothetical protein